LADAKEEYKLLNVASAINLEKRARLSEPDDQDEGEEVEVVSENTAAAEEG
jgi:hypothetical protein